MTHEQLDEFLEEHKEVSWVKMKGKQGEAAFGFKNDNLSYYQENPEKPTIITDNVLFSEEFTKENLKYHIDRGYDVDNITRITGYFAKTRSFNPGKAGELKERYKPEVE